MTAKRIWDLEIIIQKKSGKHLILSHIFYQNIYIYIYVLKKIRGLIKK